MSLDRTDSDGNNSDTASLAPGESHQAPVSRDSDEYSDTARNRPQSAVSSNREEELRGTSVSTSTNPSDSASAGPASMPSTHENNRHSNTPSSDNENADAQEEVDNPEKFIQTAHQQRPRRHPFLGQRQAPFTGLGETYDYTEIFEEDEPYTEMGPSARVWKVYNQEVIRIDSDRIEDWRDGLDSLLVFAALFSAVITTFVVQTTTNLQPDWGEVTANLLVELIAVQRAGFNGNSIDSVPRSQLYPSSTFTPRPLDVAINALWFFSLALSLSTALAAILCKQWIHQYTIMPSTNSLQERVQVHHFRFMGLEKWHVAGIIGLLPTFVHLSLGVFFVGLIIFLHDLSLIIAVIVDIVIAFTIGSYTIMNLLPVWFTDCPYKTPLTSYAFSAIRTFYHVIWKELAKTFQLPDHLHKETSLASIEKSTTTTRGQDINLDILSWLMTSSSNSSVKFTAMEAISNLPPCLISKFKERLPEFKLEDILHHHTVQSTSASETSYGRAIRALVHVVQLNSSPFPYQDLFPLPDTSNPLGWKPHSGIINYHWKDSSWELVLNHIVQALEKGEDEFRCEPLIWCFYFDFLETTEPKVFLHEHSEKLDKDIFWKMAQSVSSAISIDGLKRANSYEPEELRWTQFMLDLPTNPNESQKFGFKEMTSPCTIWEFFRTFPATPFLLQHILPVLKETYDSLIPPSPLVKKDLKSFLAEIPDHLHLLHYAAVTPVAWTPSAISKLVALASEGGEEDQKRTLEVLSITWTWILFSPDIFDDLIRNGDTVGNLLYKSFNTLHTFAKNSIECVTGVSMVGITAATRISDSSRAEELAQNCFQIMLQKLDSALTEHPQWIPLLWKTLTEQKVLSISVEPMNMGTRYWLYTVQQKYLAGIASPQKESSSEGEEVFRKEAVAYISRQETEPLTSLLRSSFFGSYYDGDNPRRVLDLQESLLSLEWLAQLKNSENEHVNRIPKEEWLPCLKQVENELEHGLQGQPWYRENFEGNLKILRDFRRSVEQGFSTQGTTLPPNQQAPDSQHSKLQEPNVKRFTFRIPSPLKRAWRRLGCMPDGRTRDDLEAGGFGTSLVEMQQMPAPPQNGSDDHSMGEMEGGGTGGLAVGGQEGSTTDDPPNNNAPPVKTIHNTSQPGKHIVEAGTLHVDELGCPDREEAPPSTTSLHDAHSTDQREVDTGSLVEAGQLGMNVLKNNELNMGDGNETMSADQREVKQVGSNRTEDSRREQMEGELDTGEVVGIEQSQTLDKPGDHLSGVQIGGGTTGRRGEDTDGTEGNIEESVDGQRMSNRSRAGGDRMEGKREGTETGTVAEGGTSKIERYKDNGAKVGTRRESWSETVPSMSGAREPEVDKGVNWDTDTEQRVADGTSGEEDDRDTGGLAVVGALQEENDGDDGGQTAVTGILRTASSGGDEGPKGYKDEGNQTTNDQSHIEVSRLDRQDESLDSTDSPEDRSKDDTTHVGSGNGETASGTDIAD